MIVFIVVSAVCLVFTRPFVKKVLAVKKVNTNADRTVGEFGLVTETIDNALESGRVMVDGLSWKARASDNTVLEAGDPCTGQGDPRCNPDCGKSSLGFAPWTVFVPHGETVHVENRVCAEKERIMPPIIGIFIVFICFF